MKRSFFLLIPFVLVACAGHTGHVRSPRPPSDTLIVLPSPTLDPKLRPYVIQGETFYPIPDADGFVEEGRASWYGKEFHGRPTASGEIYDMYKKTAAHKTLPLGTYVKVINISNHRHTIVRINDRGPFVKGRIIDLSYAAAKEIGLVGPGTAPARIIALGKEVAKLKSAVGLKPVVKVKNLRDGHYTIQVCAFKETKNALRLADRLKILFGYVEVALSRDRNHGMLYRVRVSRSDSLTEALEIENRLEKMGFEGLFIVRL
jgi:rare lipoprotein A